MMDPAGQSRHGGSRTGSGSIGEPRWPMAIAVLATGALHAVLYPELRSLPAALLGDSAWAYLVVVAVLLGVLIIGDPGRIDRGIRWLRVLTVAMITVISMDTAVVSIRLVSAILHSRSFTEDANILLVSGSAIWLTNVIAFALWYWVMDRGGPVGRARGPMVKPAFVFPEMVNPELVEDGWYPRFVDYLHLSFSTATSLSPSDVSGIKAWAKLAMMSEESISLVLAVLVVARAVNILK